MTDPSATEALEALIDRHGLLHVVTGLELICSEKAAHLRINRQDRVTACNWDSASRIFDKAASRIEPLQL